MLPPWAELTIDVSVASKMLEASRHLAHLDGLVSMLPDKRMFIEAIVYKEAVASCAIDGLRETDPIVEQYRKVLVRESQAVIGGKRFTEESIFSAYSELEKDHLEEGLSKYDEALKRTISYLTKLMSRDFGFPDDPLFRMALVQYQFEATQAFPGKAGRAGRLFSILYLIQEGMLCQPCICPSAYHLQRISAYSEAIRSVSTSRNWKQWVLHMLDIILSVSDYTAELILRIQALKEKIGTAILENGLQVERMDLSTLFSVPYISPKTLMSDSIKSLNTAKKYLGQLEELGFLAKTRVGKEYVWINTGLMQILSE